MRAHDQAVVQRLARARSRSHRRGRAAARRGSCRRRHGRRSAPNRPLRPSPLGLGDAFGEPRNRHADVGRASLRAGPQRQRRRVARRAAPATAASAPPAGSPSRNSPPPLSRAIACTASRPARRRAACVPWNSKNSVGASRQRRASNRGCRRAICISSSSSMRATGMPELDRLRSPCRTAPLERLERGRPPPRSPPGCRAAAASPR